MSKENLEDHTIKTLKLEAEMDELPGVSDFVKRALLEIGCSEKMCKQIDIVVEEIFVNIVSYAYPGDAAEKPVLVECGRKDHCAYLTFHDNGVQYNPLEKEDPATDVAEKMTIGGYGIFMVKNIMDEIEYRYVYENGENILRMWKKID